MLRHARTLYVMAVVIVGFGIDLLSAHPAVPVA